MKIYFAGGFCEEKKYDKFKAITWSRRLISYLSYNKQIEEYFFSQPNEIMLDSGAFSAWNSGIVITLDDYMNFLSSHPHINLYYNLDVIGDPENTWRNQEIMEKNGFNPLPVYHFGEERKYLKNASHIHISV